MALGHLEARCRGIGLSRRQMSCHLCERLTGCTRDHCIDSLSSATLTQSSTSMYVSLLRHQLLCLCAILYSSRRGHRVRMYRYKRIYVV